MNNKVKIVVTIVSVLAFVALILSVMTTPASAKEKVWKLRGQAAWGKGCLLYTSPSPRDRTRSRMPSSA